MGNKIIIDEKDFNEKVIGWVERRTYVSSNDLIALFKDLTTTILIDDSIEDRATIKNLKFDLSQYPNLFTAWSVGYKQGATEQSIISEIKSKWISVKDSLPKQASFVIAHKDNGLTLGLYYNADNEFMYGEIDQTSQVTHWMPLPTKL
jgi:hypothetical protein